MIFGRQKIMVLLCGAFFGNTWLTYGSFAYCEKCKASKAERKL